MTKLDPNKTTLQCAHSNKQDGKPAALGQIDWRGMWLYCRLCRCAHLFSWEKLGVARDELIKQHEEAEKPVKESA
jgi:hypothetical protein